MSSNSVISIYARFLRLFISIALLVASILHVIFRILVLKGFDPLFDLPFILFFSIILTRYIFLKRTDHVVFGLGLVLFVMWSAPVSTDVNVFRCYFKLADEFASCNSHLRRLRFTYLSGLSLLFIWPTNIIFVSSAAMYLLRERDQSQ